MRRFSFTCALNHPRPITIFNRRWAGGAIYSFKSSLGDGKHRGLVAFSVGDEDGVVVRAGEDGHVAGTGSGLDEPDGVCSTRKKSLSPARHPARKTGFPRRVPPQMAWRKGAGLG